MGYEIEVEPNWEQLNEAIDVFRFLGGNMRKAVQVATNKTLRPVATESKRLIRDNLNIKLSTITPELHIERMTRVNNQGSIWATKRGLQLEYFATAASTPRVRVKTGGSIKPVVGRSGMIEGGTYFATLKDGRRVIMGKLANPAPGQRAIKVFFGPSVSQSFKIVKEDSNIMSVASDEFTSQIEDAMRYLLTKKLPPEYVL